MVEEKKAYSVIIYPDATGITYTLVSVPTSCYHIFTFFPNTVDYWELNKQWVQFGFKSIFKNRHEVSALIQKAGSTNSESDHKLCVGKPSFLFQLNQLNCESSMCVRSERKASSTELWFHDSPWQRVYTEQSLQFNIVGREIWMSATVDERGEKILSSFPNLNFLNI